MPRYPHTLHGEGSVAIKAITFDSRQVVPGSMFVAVRGLQADGHNYMGQAIAAGASVVVCEQLPEPLPKEVTFVQVDDSAKALGHYASAFYNDPSTRIKLVGVTGTNGKTTNVTLLHSLFLKLGYHTGLISTIENKIGNQRLETRFTTPDAVQLNRLLAKMVQKGCTHAFMEVSSHALHQHRVAGIQFAGGVFTNISHDHLDYHKTFANYISAKKMLFDMLPGQAFALVNTDDKRGMVMLQNCVGQQHTFALKSGATFKARLIDNSFDGLQLEIDNRQVWFRLTGAFNAYNLLSVYAAAVLLGEEPEAVLTELSAISPARGRFEQIIGRNNIRAIVDYCHTPDALRNVLETIQGIKKPYEQVITVVGCGGDRDRAKRPEMARIAAKHSQKVILTSDNPRSEDPEAIVNDMKTGIDLAHRARTLAITDRREAIQAACMLARQDDIVLVAGKGHETYQEINGVRHPFDDKQVVAEFLSLPQE